MLAAIAALLIAFAAVPAGKAASAAHAVPAVPTIPTGLEDPPPGAVVQTVTSNLGTAVDLAFDPSDPSRLFYTEKTTGRVWLIVNGVRQATPVITFTVSTSSERGLLGIAMDPSFGVSNRYIYVYYTSPDASQCPGFNAENRVARFEENNGVGSNPVIIFRSCQSAGNHNGGIIRFGPDGKLYISVGDNATAANSQNVQVTQGKIHRINPDGSIPSDNPVFTQTGALPSLYAIGLRNTFGLTFDPPDTQAPWRLFASENGPGCDDEMNRIEPGFNYGWRASYPCDDANGPDITYNSIPPLWYQPSGSCCVAPTGLTVYTGSNIPQWQNHLFMCSYNDGALRHFYLTSDRQWATSVNRVSGVTCNMGVWTGPDGNLYYLQGGGYNNATLMRIVGTGGATPSPSATNTPTNTPTPTRTATNTPPPPTSTGTGTPAASPTATPPCPSGWAIVNSPNPGATRTATPADTNVNGVAAASANDVWAVGEYGPFPFNSMTLHWDGSSWTHVPSPNAGTSTNRLQDVAVIAPNDVWAVGFYFNASGQPSRTLTMHWDGVQWTIVPSPNRQEGVAFNYLNGVAGTASNDVWAVGSSSAAGSPASSLTMHWDGVQWTIVDSPNPVTGSNALSSVVMRSSTEVYAVGGSQESLALRWNGTQWVHIPTPNPYPSGSNPLADVDITPGGDVWAVGYTAPDFNNFFTFVLRNWQQVPSPNPPMNNNVLTSVSVVSDNDIWAVGHYQSPNTGRYETFTIHWDGTSWSIVPSPTPPTNVVLYGSDAVAGNDVWAVGFTVPTRPDYARSVILRYTGDPCATPTITPMPSPTATITAMPTRTPTAIPGTPTATPTACTVAFTDVPPDHPFYPFVRCLACRGIIGGYADGTFRPYNPTTRGQMAKIVSNAAGFSDPIPSNRQTFSDVPPTHTFWVYIERLAWRGIVGGYADGTFRPDNWVTRGQMTKFASNAAGFYEPVPAGRQTYTDVPPGHTFWEYIERLSARGIISGYECGRPPAGPCDPQRRPWFLPDSTITRGQTSKIVANTFFLNCRPVADVKIINFAYDPETVTISVGDSVRWINVDLDYHTVTSDVPGQFDSGRMNQFDVWLYTFNTPGAYGYYCLPHPYMRGSVIVRP
jgi:glucose/arabinose dehydrogenase